MITIRHTHAEGTLIEGSRKGDGVWDVLKGLRDNWRYFRSIGQIGIGQSRDRLANNYKIKRAAEALRAAGYEVTVEVDETERRTVAEIEAGRADRATERAERYEDRSGRVNAQAMADYGRARQMGEAIPFGQPVMPDHHSYRRDMNYRAKIGRTYDRAFERMNRAEELQRRSDAAVATQAHRESIPTTLRRIANLEADQRRVQRTIDGRLDYVSDGAGGHNLALVKPQGDYLERLQIRATDITDQLAYWREHVKAAEAAGIKVWTAADFTKGDYVQWHDQWWEVLRVNPKSLTVPAGLNKAPVVTNADSGYPWTSTIPYDKVRGRKTAAEIAGLVA